MNERKTDVDGTAEENVDDNKPAARGLLRLPLALLTLALVAMIRGYQIFISPMLGQSCRFTPTCSAYAIAAIRKHGPIRGGWASVKRILRCHPWDPGGYDPP